VEAVAWIGGLVPELSAYRASGVGNEGLFFDN